jgi:hypothetical protein
MKKNESEQDRSADGDSDYWTHSSPKRLKSKTASEIRPHLCGTSCSDRLPAHLLHEEVIPVIRKCLMNRLTIGK